MPKLVLVIRLYGGLYHVMSLFLLFLVLVLIVSFLYSMVLLCPLALRALSYSGLACSNCSSSHEIRHSLFVTEIGICFKTCGGWLDPVCTYLIVLFGLLLVNCQKVNKYKPGLKSCDLCLTEKLYILKESIKPENINKRIEASSLCVHRNRYKLANIR